MRAPIGEYAMGWFVGNIRRKRVLWHNGEVPDFMSFMGLVPDDRKGFVLLINANHVFMNVALTEVGSGVLALLAGHDPEPPQFGWLQWLQRCLLLIPLFQITDLVATFRLLHRMGASNVVRLPSLGRKWAIYILLPLIFHLAIASTLLLLIGRLRTFMWLFMSDVAWIVLVCGGFAILWAIIRSALILRVLQKPALPHPVPSQVMSDALGADVSVMR